MHCRKWFRIISPCVIASLYAVFVVVNSYVEAQKPNKGSFFRGYEGVSIFTKFLIIMIVTDIAVKMIFKKNTLYIWNIEMPAILIMHYLFSHFIYLG